ncbi:MAG: TetR/AcrR family transcriptional regulator C-terminal domain-containing protein [Sphaerochaetaceae bacterium]
MSNSIITKAALAQSLKSCMEKKPLEKISIGEVCARCGLNRKSFYYHFRDKYELVNWIYETEINTTILSNLENKKVGELALMICQYIYENRVFYLNALQVSGPHSFHDYFCRQIQPLVDKTLDVKGDDTLDLEELSELIGDFCLSAVRRWIGRPDPQEPQKFLDNLTKVSISLSGRLISLFLA